MTNNTRHSSLSMSTTLRRARYEGVNAIIVTFHYSRQWPSPRTSTFPRPPLFCITDTTKMSTESAETQHTARRRCQNGRMAQCTPQSHRPLQSTRRSRKNTPWTDGEELHLPPRLGMIRRRRPSLSMDLSIVSYALSIFICVISILSTYTGVAGI